MQHSQNITHLKMATRKKELLQFRNWPPGSHYFIMEVARILLVDYLNSTSLEALYKWARMGYNKTSDDWQRVLHKV